MITVLMSSVSINLMFLISHTCGYILWRQFAIILPDLIVI